MSVINIFLFNDIVKVKLGINSPSGVSSPTDGQVITEGNITYTYDLSSNNWNILAKTNQIFVSGLSSDITLSFSGGDIIKNGSSVGTSTTISNGDIVRLSVLNPTLNSVVNYAFVADSTNLEFNVELNDPATSNYGTETTRTLSLNDELVKIDTNTKKVDNDDKLIDINTKKGDNDNKLEDEPISFAPLNTIESISSELKDKVTLI